MEILRELEMKCENYLLNFKLEAVLVILLHFYHQIPGKKQLEGGKVYFSLQFQGTQSF